MDRDRSERGREAASKRKEEAALPRDTARSQEMVDLRKRSNALPQGAKRANTVTDRRFIYLDHNATTPVRPEVFEAMAPYLQGKFGNPASIYALGQQSRAAVEAARSQVAKLLNAAPDEIVFTSCGSEADVLAVGGGAQCAFQQSGGNKNHIVASSIEHDAVRQLMTALKARGFKVTEVPVDRFGRVSAEDVRKAIERETALVTVMLANNEVGTVQPIREIASVCREKGVLSHTDAVQAVGRIPVDVRALDIDLLSMSGHKINAPKGVAALFARRGVRLAPVVTGNQEKNRRGGTENVPGIVALGAACLLAQRELAQNSERLLALRQALEAGCRKISGSRINGHPEQRLPGTCHVSFKDLDGHALAVALDLEGICAATGPACASGSTEPSHVLRAMGVEPEFAAGSLRLSLGWGSTEEDVRRTLDVLPRAIDRIRKARKAYA